MRRKLSRVYSVICILALLVTSASCLLYGTAFADTSADPSTAVFIPTEDTSVAGSNNQLPNFYYSSDTLQVRHHTTGTNIRRAYVKYDISAFNQEIDHATLRLYATTIGATASRTVEIGGVADTWAAQTATWSSGGTPVPSAKNASEFIANLVIDNPTPGTQWTGGQWYEVDVTNFVKSQSDKVVSIVLWVRDTSPNGQASNNEVFFNSSEAAMGQPELVIKAAEGVPEPDPNTPVTKTPTDDTFVAGTNNTSPNPFYSLDRLEARHNYDGTLIRRAYIKFDFSDFEKNIQSARLRLYATTIGATASRTVEIGGVADTWSAQTATWSASGTAVPSAKNASTFIANLLIENPTPGTTWASQDNGFWYEIDVTDFLKAQSDKVASFAIWIRDTSPNGTASDNQVYFNSSEAVTGKPELIILPQTEDPDPQPEKVANVTANPQPGLLEAATEVVLSTETAGADIYYKIDDQTEWTLYTAPINVAKRTTITAYAKKDLMLDSDPVVMAYSFPVDTDIQIQPALTPITLDGSIDAEDPSGEWAGAELLEIAGAADSAGIHAADIYFKYDYGMLYLGAKIKDPTPMVNAQSGSSIWNGDCLELFVGDEDLDFTQYPDKVSAMIPSDIQIVISGGTANGYNYYFYSNGKGYSYPPMLMEIKKDSDGKGYTLEAAIPLSALGYERPWENEGKKLILNAVLNDGGSAGRGQWGWTTNNEQTKKSRGLWGKVAFAPSPDPAQELSVIAQVNNSTRVVTITGQTFNVNNEEVAMTLTGPSGEICDFNQARSDENGHFAFTGRINAFESGNGTYKVTVGGTGITVPVCASFDYSYTYQPGDDAALGSLSIGNGILVPSYSPSRNIYIAMVDKNAENFNLTAAARDAKYSKMTINGSEVQSGAPYITSIKKKFNPFLIEVTAEDGKTTERYLVVAIKTNLKVVSLITKQIEKFLEKFTGRYQDILHRHEDFVREIEKAFKF